MMLSLEDRFLLEIYRFQQDGGHTFVKESLLISQLKKSYKQVHQLGSFWQEKGCVKVYSERGGTSEFQLTQMGYVQVEQVHKTIRKRRIFGGFFLFFVLVGICFLLVF